MYCPASVIEDKSILATIFSILIESSLLLLPLSTIFTLFDEAVILRPLAKPLVVYSTSNTLVTSFSSFSLVSSTSILTVTYDILAFSIPSGKIKATSLLLSFVIIDKSIFSVYISLILSKTSLGPVIST